MFQLKVRPYDISPLLTGLFHLESCSPVPYMLLQRVKLSSFYGLIIFYCVNVHSCSIHSSTDGHLGCFHILVIVNNIAMNIGLLMFFQISVLVSFGYISRSGVAGAKGRSIFIYLFLFLKLFYCCSITVVCIFSPPLYPTQAKPTYLPCFHLPPWFSPYVLYSSS